jgi:CrcB protein
VTAALLVALGGAIGSVTRYLINLGMTRAVPHLVVPYATFGINVIGCFVIGVLAGMVAAERVAMSTEARAFLFVGVLGGFTTFSTFGLDTLVLLQSGLRGTALWNVAGQVGLGLVAVFAGFLSGSR